MSDDGSLASRPLSPVSIVPDHLPTARPYRFTWDPSSRRPGPESVSGTTEGRGGGDHFSAQPRLALLDASSSLTLALSALPQEWSSTKHGFHAISTVLNNPHKRQAPPKSHSSLPTVLPADLPRVRRKDFDSYLRAVTPEWDRFLHNTQWGREGVAQIGARPSTQEDDDNAIPQPSITSLVKSMPIPPLDTVPSVFFEQKFKLGDPLIFNAVTEQHLSSQTDLATLAISTPLLEKFSHYADVVEQHLVHEISLRSTSFFAALTNLHDLQSESEHCLTQIASLRKSLTDLDENYAKRGLELVKRQARADNLVRVIDGVKMVGEVVEMSKVARGLVGAGQWGEALGIIEEMDSLWEGRPSGNEQAMNDTPAKLSSLAGIQEEPEPEQDEEHQEQRQPRLPSRPSSASKGSLSISLSSLHAYASLPDHLQALTMEIAASLSSEFVAVLHVDLIERVSRGRSRSQEVVPQEVSEKSAQDCGLRDRLRPLVQGLVRTGGLEKGILSWREVVLGEVRGVVKARLPATDVDATDIDGDERTNRNGTGGKDTMKARYNPDTKSKAGLANHLRSMRHPEFMTLLRDIYSNLLNLIEGLQEQGRLIEEVLGAADGLKGLGRPPQNGSSPTAPVTTTSPSTAVHDELSDIISSAAEVSNTQVARVISMRVDEHAALELADFLVFFNESWGFVVRCEVICRRMIVELRGVVVSQARVFLQAFHQARISRSAKLVEDEQWSPTEIPSSLQHVINVIIDSAVRDAPELVIKSDDNSVLSDQPSSDTGSASPITTKSPDPPGPRAANGIPVPTSGSSKHLRIEERTYFAVSATAEVLALLLDYLRFVVNLPMLTTDSMSRIIEFLKAFNSRTCQVVLGAGAMRSAGLKNITAKHLALASQSLSIMAELIPYVRETFRRHLSPKQAVMLVEFDKVKRDYQEHQNEIHSKLIAIMGDRLTAHIETLQAIDWEVPKAGGGVNDYMEILVKETVTLHKVLSRYLSSQVVEYVMTQVFAAISHGLSEEYGKIELPHQEAKARLLADAKYLHQKLSGLKNVGTPSGMLVTVVSEKTVRRPPGAPPTPTRANTLGSSANQRLKGLLSGKSPTFDKALPIPVGTSSTSSLLQSQTALVPRSTSPISPITNNVIANGINAIQTIIRTPSPPSKPAADFKQIEGSESEISEPGPMAEMSTERRTEGTKKGTNLELDLV